MIRSILVALLAATLLQSCHTFIGANGSKERQLFPSKDRTGSLSLDTGRFIKRPFDIRDYVNKKGFDNGKKIIEPIEGAQLQQLVNTNGRYLVYFWYPHCPGSRPPIRKLDSLCGTGTNILIASLTANYSEIDTKLAKRCFSQYPYYTIATRRHTNILLTRKILFIKEACERCYDEYRDDLRYIDYLVIENGEIHPVMDYDPTNILRR